MKPFALHDIEITEVSFREVEQFAHAAGKEGVSMANPDGCIWFAGKHEGLIVAFAAVTITSNRSQARFKSDYVLKEYRGIGLHKALLTLRLNLARDKFVQRATAYCNKNSYTNYLKAGFKYTGKSNASGAKYVMLKL